MNTSIRSLILPALTCVLAAQSPTRILDPQSVTGMGTGWDVDPKNGLLNMRFPLATVGGDLPIPVVLRFNASPVFENRRKMVYDPEIGRTVPQVNVIGRPAHATLHFGFITSGTEYVGGYLVPQRFVLEDGSQPWFGVQGVPGGSFTLPGLFGLGTVSASLPKVSSDGAYATYQTNSAGLGSWASTVQAKLPTTYGTLSATYKVLMDKDKARILVFLPALNAWAPILWVDRFGHSVTFKWIRTVGGGGYRSTDSVEALNGQGRGALVRWANANPGDATNTTAAQILRVDFIGFQAPSLAVTGYPSVSMNVPSGVPDPGLADNYALILDSPFLACRPTAIQVGDTGMPAAPSWAPAIAATPEGLAGTLATWTLGFDPADPDYLRLKTFTDPAGLATTFSYGLTYIPWGTGPVTGTNSIQAVNGANSTSGGLTYSRSWVRQTPVYNPADGTVSGSWAVTEIQQFTGGVSCAVPSVRYTYAGPGENREYANGALKTVEILSGGTPWSTTTYSYGPGGEDASLSAINSQTTARNGEPTVIVTSSLDSKGLPNSTTLTVGGATTQTVSYSWDKRPAVLAPALPSGSTTTRYLTQGGTYATTLSTVWNGTTLLPTQSSTTSEGLTKGTNIGFDTAGRLTSSTPYVAGFTPGAGANAGQTFGYDSQGRVTSSTTGGSLTQTASYCGMGLPQSVTDATSVTTNLIFDSRGRLKRQTRPGSPQVDVEYQGEASRTVSQDGITVTENYDAFGRLTTRSHTGGLTSTYSYDLLGRVVSVSETASSSTRTQGTTYDLLGRPTYQSSPGSNNQVFLSYSASGRKTVVTASSGAGTSTITKDPWGQVLSSTDVSGLVTTTTYNGLDQPLSVQQSGSGASQSRSFGYNGLGFLISRTEPETGTTTFSGHTMAGQPTSIQESGGRTRTLTYDSFGRLTLLSSATNFLEYGYQGARLSWATSSGPGALPVRQDYAYTAPGGALSSETTTQGSTTLSAIGYGMGSDGHLNSITYPSGRVVNYQWSGGRVSGVGVGSATLAGLGYDGWGNLTQVTYASGARTEWFYTATGASLGTWKVTPVGDAAESRNYTYDANMNLATLTPDWSSLTHDGKGRLTAATGYNRNWAFSHDPLGNNTSATVTPTPGPDWLNPFAFNGPWSDNRVPAWTSSGKWTGWQSNTRGETTLLGTKVDSMVALTPEWDALGRLSAIATPGANQAYLYAPSGMRVWVADGSDSSRTRMYGYTSGGMLLTESTPSQWKRDVIYAGGRVIAEIDAEGIHELHTDHLGSPRVITAGSNGMTENGQPVLLGRVEGKQAFAPYGERITDPQWTNGYAPTTGFTGHVQQDATGLIYMRGRYYSPAWHRFLNSDQGVDPMQFNQFAYVAGSPLQATDPSGMAKCTTYYYHFEGSYWQNGRLIVWQTPQYSATFCDSSGDNGSSSEIANGGGSGSPQTQQKTPCNSGKSALGSLGLGVGASAEFVIGGAVGAWNGTRTVYSLANGESAIVNTSGSANLGNAYSESAWGWSANAGVGLVGSWTNAQTPSQLSGKSRATTVTFGAYQFQFSRSGGGIFGLSAAWGKGIGFGVSTYNYNSTVYTYQSDGCGNQVQTPIR